MFVFKIKKSDLQKPAQWFASSCLNWLYAHNYQQLAVPIPSPLFAELKITTGSIQNTASCNQNCRKNNKEFQ